MPGSFRCGVPLPRRRHWASALDAPRRRSYERRERGLSRALHEPLVDPARGCVAREEPATLHPDELAARLERSERAGHRGAPRRDQEPDDVVGEFELDGDTTAPYPTPALRQVPQ